VNYDKSMKSNLEHTDTIDAAARGHQAVDQ
jgi:hypothetical protein